MRRALVMICLLVLTVFSVACCQPSPDELIAMEFSEAQEYAGDTWNHCPGCGAVDPAVYDHPNPYWRPKNGGHAEGCELYEKIKAHRGY